MTRPPADEGWYRPPPPTRPYGAPVGQPAPPTREQPGYYPGTQQPGSPHPGEQPHFTYGPRLAAWWQRLLARILDGLVAGTIGFLIGLPVWIPYLEHALALAEQAARTGQPLTFDAETSGRAAVASAIIYLTYFVYEWLQVGIWGRTLGKLALGIRIVDQRTRAKPGWQQAGARSAIFTLSPLIPYVGALLDLVNVSWLLWDRPWRQCLHDKAARTIVEVT